VDVVNQVGKEDRERKGEVSLETRLIGSFVATVEGGDEVDSFEDSKVRSDERRRSLSGES
jgi:hypothetical protein